MRRTGRAFVAAVAAVLLTTACGDDAVDSSAPSAAQPSTTVSTPAAPSSTAPAPHSAEVVTNDGARLQVTLAVGGVSVDGQADLCAGASLAGRAQVPVTLTVRNLGDRTAPFPPVRLETIGADGGRGDRTLLRDPAGECTPFPRIPQLGAGETAVFRGSTPAGDGRIEVRISETNFLLTAPRS